MPCRLRLTCSWALHSADAHLHCSHVTGHNILLWRSCRRRAQPALSCRPIRHSRAPRLHLIGDGRLQAAQQGPGRAPKQAAGQPLLHLGGAGADQRHSRLAARLLAGQPLHPPSCTSRLGSARARWHAGLACQRAGRCHPMHEDAKERTGATHCCHHITHALTCIADTNASSKSVVLGSQCRCKR